MSILQLTFVGGCHVAGYLVEHSASFVNHLEQRLAPCVVLMRPYAKIEKLAQLLDPLVKTKSDYVFLQLGNFEFSASWTQILKSTLGRVPPRTSLLARAQGAGSASGGSSLVQTSNVNPQSVSAQLIAGVDSPQEELQSSKVLVGSLLYWVSWVLMRKYRKQFHYLNQLIRNNPQTIFVCMTPFPCLPATHNKLRRLGGRIMRHRLWGAANLRWVDTHEILDGQPGIFADGVHLNSEGHRLLADHLCTVCTVSYAKVPA